MYYIYALLTAPGVVVHELGHLFFCLLAGVKIFKVKLFQFGETAGFVQHEEPHKFYQAIAISFGPLIINSIIALFLFAKISHNYGAWFTPLTTGRDLSLLWLWLGIAIGLHAIPSTGDAQSLFQTSTYRWWRNPLKLIGLPFVGALYALNLFKRLHIEFLYTGILFWLGNIFLKK